VEILKSLAGRAAVGFALVSGVTAAAVVTSSVLAEREADRREQMLIHYGDDLVHAAEIQASAERMVAASRGYLLTSEPALLERAKQAERQLDFALQGMDRAEAQPSEQEALTQVRLSAARYRGLLEEILEGMPASEDRPSLGRTLRERLGPARQALDDTIQRLVAHKRRLEVGARIEAARIRARTVTITMALGATALLVSGMLAWLFTRRLAEIHRREQESTQRATEALRAKEELLGIVAHDLRSPLGAIVLRASWIATRNTSEPVRASAESIRATCKRMGHLITTLLDAASVEAGRLSVRKSWCHVSDLFADVLETFGPAASTKGVRLEQQILPRGLTVQVDRDRLFQVLSNLAANALELTSAGGAVVLSAIRAYDVVRFRVRDTGPGIPTEHLAQIFDRYWKSGKGGSGLGLYIARGIVAAHDGQIWAENNQDRGATLRFEIPSPPEADSRGLSPAEQTDISSIAGHSLLDQPGHP
jgi:signal transduction histidine kinase